MAAIDLVDLQKRFGNVTVVDGVSLQIQEGEFIVLVGPSGCGKTTTLRMIAGLERPSDGEIQINGVVVNDLPPQRRDLAMVFQNYALYSHYTVAKNLAYPLKSQRISKPEIQSKVSEVAELLGLSHVLKRRPGQLSGGQRQRVALGRAIVREPRAFLMDEPLSNLDASLRVEMRKEIIELSRRLKATVVYVTHDQVEAMTMADRVVVMNHGRVQQVGPPSEVFEKPRNTFVAGFIGTPKMNFFSAQIDLSPETGVRLGQEFVPILSDLAVSQDQSVTIGIRPEAFALSESGLPVDVTLTENLGSETLVYAGLAGQQCWFQVPTRAAPRRGDSVYLSVQPEDIHVFESDENGNRICPK